MNRNTCEEKYRDNLRRRLLVRITNGNRTEWGPIQSVIIQVITKKSDNRSARVLFVYHEYEYRPNRTSRRKRKLCNVTLKLRLVDLRYNFKCDWFVKLSDNNFARDSGK